METNEERDEADRPVGRVLKRRSRGLRATGSVGGWFAPLGWAWGTFAAASVAFLAVCGGHTDVTCGGGTHLGAADVCVVDDAGVGGQVSEDAGLGTDASSGDSAGSAGDASVRVDSSVRPDATFGVADGGQGDAVFADSSVSLDSSLGIDAWVLVDSGVDGGDAGVDAWISVPCVEVNSCLNPIKMVANGQNGALSYCNQFASAAPVIGDQPEWIRLDLDAEDNCGDPINTGIYQINTFVDGNNGPWPAGLMWEVFQGTSPDAGDSCPTDLVYRTDAGETEEFTVIGPGSVSWFIHVYMPPDASCGTASQWELSTWITVQ